MLHPETNRGTRASALAHGASSRLPRPTRDSRVLVRNTLTENGTKFGKMDRVIEEGISPEECAEQIIKAIAKEKEQVVLGKGLPRWGIYIKRYFPPLYYRILRNAEVEK